jgi:NAD(P)-dependent dehydrogenase (short-subunit alcohol dehydrogenase family)
MNSAKHGVFSDKKFLISGASSGIGQQVCQQLAKDGATLMMVSRNKDRLQNFVKTLDGSEHQILICDLSQHDELKQALDTVDLPAFGPIDGMVLCAGQHLFRPFALSKEQHFLQQFSANVLTATNTIHAFLKLLSKKTSSIVLLSSAVIKSSGVGTAAYSVSKAALCGLAKGLAHELAARNIRINTILPGIVKTPMTDKLFSKLSQEQIGALTAKHLLGLGSTTEIANVISFLLSDQSKWMTGAEVVVDGGFLS